MLYCIKQGLDSRDKMNDIDDLIDIIELVEQLQTLKVTSLFLPEKYFKIYKRYLKVTDSNNSFYYNNIYIHTFTLI